LYRVSLHLVQLLELFVSGGFLLLLFLKHKVARGTVRNCLADDTRTLHWIVPEEMQKKSKYVSWIELLKTNKQTLSTYLIRIESKRWPSRLG
jgi:hypothetical protein